MRISGNELSVTVTKACVGAGVPRGVAEDLGKACLHLALDGHDGLPSILAAIETFDPDCEAPDWRKEGHDWHASFVHCLPHGPSVIDFAHLARALHSSGRAVVVHVDFPDLIAGLAASDGTAYDIVHEGQSVSLGMGTERHGGSAAATAGIDVDAGQWKKLQDLAAEIMVPADESNLADAGAGTSDND